MCGILCVFNAFRGGAAMLPKVLERARRLRHRGPDWSGVHVHGDSVMAHERLAIVDVDNGSQPLSNREGNVWLAVNGEIYNHRDLRASLPADTYFATESDCEVVLPLFEQHADEPAALLNRLNGIFAFVVSDERTGRFVAARDHMGIIPLYMGRDGDGALWFASEMKALHDVCVTFEDFPPGHYYDSRTGKLHKWYNPQWHDENHVPKVQTSLEEVREGLIAAVKRQMMSDVPYGVLLSGGLDSSLIASIASRLCTERDANGWPLLHSFSVGLKDAPDLKAARIVADQLHTQHHEFHFTVEEGINALDDVIYHLETYDVTTVRAATPMYLMSRKIKCRGVKMVLSGEGSDEMFGGYLYFHKCPSASEHQRECVRKLRLLHKFDNLRANKSTAAWGVEARVPFLDRQFLDLAMERINPDDKLCGRAADGRIEKWVIREAFRGFLPDEILWRQKEQFSDGVGYNWIDSLKAHADRQVSDSEMANAKHRFPYNTPATKEAYFIRAIFEKHFPSQSARECVPGGPSIACSTPAALAWDASFKQFADCSGRSVAGVHAAAYDQQRRAQAKGEAVKDEHLLPPLATTKQSASAKDELSALKSASPSSSGDDTPRKDSPDSGSDAGSPLVLHEAGAPPITIGPDGVQQAVQSAAAQQPTLGKEAEAALDAAAMQSAVPQAQTVSAV